MNKLKHIFAKKSRHCTSTSDSPQQSEHTSMEEMTAASIKERIRVRIICPSARILVFRIDISKRLSELKNEVILDLLDDPASLPLFATDVRQLSPRYRLIRAEFEGVELNETLTIVQLRIRNNDALVLVPRRSMSQYPTTPTRETKAPTDQEIEIATRNVIPKNSQMPVVDVNEIFQQTNIQCDVRKVLISLAQASAIVIGAGPCATRLIEMLKQKLINKQNYRKDSMQWLMDMGFTQEQAEYALRMHNGVSSAALEYLMHEAPSSSSEQPLPLPKSSSIFSPSGIIVNDDSMQNTCALLEIVRIYSHRDIPTTPETVQSLTEMGFEEADVLIALKKTCNNKASACEWLCGNRTGSLIELREGLAPDSPILKTILESPHVQISLSNPKIFLAFISILENENSIRAWGGDNDTTTVITNILQKYHEEKHVLGINQFYSQRA